jgi:hypothetical protein
MMSGADKPPLAVGTGVSCTATALGDGDTVRVSTAAAVGDGLAVGVGVAGGVVAASVGAAVGGAAGAAVGGAVRTGVGSGAGGGVGCCVGGAVGGAVGGGVGGGGVLAARTTIVPFMAAWMSQWYANVPATANVIDREPPASITPVSHALVSAVAVWLNGSRLVHLTVSPTLTVVDGGL